jgi:hypothetical protein
MKKIIIFFIKFVYSFAKKNYEHQEVFKTEEEWILLKWYLLRKLVKLMKK